jgi:NAD(P)-dependent dehydrogenase (short-subunit alcohol dehydrogenase family)
VLGFTRVVAQEWGGYRIRVNAGTACGTDALERAVVKEMGSERKKEMEAHLNRIVPLGGKLGSVDDAANLNVYFLRVTNRAS